MNAAKEAGKSGAKSRVRQCIRVAERAWIDSTRDERGASACFVKTLRRPTLRCRHSVTNASDVSSWAKAQEIRIFSPAADRMSFPPWGMP
eukprot:3713743-Pleurochrysis_carterae.AAC.4